MYKVVCQWHSYHGEPDRLRPSWSLDSGKGESDQTNQNERNKKAKGNVLMGVKVRS
jgi:hypothetical protein